MSSSSLGMSGAYLPFSIPASSFFPQTALAAITFTAGYSFYIQAAPPNPKNENSVPQNCKIPEDSSKIEDSFSAPHNQLILNTARRGILALSALQSLIILNTSALPSTTASGASLTSGAVDLVQKVTTSLSFITPSPPPAAYPRLNPTLLTWNPISAAVLSTIISMGIVRLSTFRGLGKNFTFKITRPSGLVTTGIYSWIQHPSYTSGCTIICATAAWFFRLDGVLGSLIVPTLFSAESIANYGWIWNNLVLPFGSIALQLTAAIKRVSEEEALLKREFGEEWIEYNRRTPRFIPFLF